jgi:hypothetical protein
MFLGYYSFFMINLFINNIGLITKSLDIYFMVVIKRKIDLKVKKLKKVKKVKDENHLIEAPVNMKK